MTSTRSTPNQPDEDTRRSQIDWTKPVPQRAVDSFAGPQATSAELALQFAVAAAAAATFLGAEAYCGWGWSIVQKVVAALLAFDLFGGVVTNATSAAKRWYHRIDQTLRHHLAFVLLHAVQPALVVAFFAPDALTFAAASFAFVFGGAMVILALPLYLHRPVAACLVAVGIILGLYILAAPLHFEWFFPVYVVKVLHSHLVFEAPFRPAHGQRAP